MAIRQLPSGSWQIYYRDPFTQKRHYATFGSKEEAEKQDALIRYRLTYERDTFMPAIEMIPGGGQALEAVFHAYLIAKVTTEKQLRWHLDCMATALALFGDREIGTIGDADMRTVMNAEASKGVKATTVRARVKCLRRVLAWAERRGYIDRVPRLPDLPKGEPEKFVPPSEEELDRMLEAAPDHVRRVIILGAKLGLRVGPSECFRLTWRDVDLEKKLCRVQAAAKNPSEPWREVPIKDELVVIFREWRKVDVGIGAKFIVHGADGRPLKSIKTAWATMLRNAGIERPIRPYDLRHAFATDLIAAGVDVGTVARLMGHSSPMMVLKHYQHVMTKQKRSAVEALPSLSLSRLALREPGSRPEVHGISRSA